MTTTQLPQLPSPAVADIAEKSDETMQWLRSNIKVGYTDQRGPAWWAAGAVTKSGTWEGIPDGSHFAGPVPIEAVTAQLDVPLAKGTVAVTYTDENGQRQVALDPDTAPIVNIRNGQIFSYPTSGYRIHPYLETLHGFIENILDDPDVGVGSVGLLKKGGVAFLQAVLPETFEVAGYGYQPYITAVTSADLSRRTWFGTGAKGAVCDNTVNAAIAGALTQMGIKHTSKSDLRVTEARERLGIRLVQVAEEIGDLITALTGIEVTDREFSKWLDEIDPLPDADPKSSTGGRKFSGAKARRDERVRLWTEDPKVHPWAGTAFGVFQADNTYRTWTQNVARMTRFERNVGNDAFGVTAREDRKALAALAKVKGRDDLLLTV